MSWKYRTGEISYKEFQSLPKEKKTIYLELIEQLVPEDRSSTDEIIINQYSSNENKIKNFYSLEDIE